MKIITMAALAALISLGVSQTRAEQTNVVQTLHIQLRGVQPGGTIKERFTITTGIAPARIDTRHVIQALGAVTGNTFSNSARLVIVTPLGGGYSSIQIRDLSQTVDVSAFFDHEQRSDFVSGSVSNLYTHRTVGLDYSIQRFALHNSGGTTLSLQFDVNGFATETSLNGLEGVSHLDLDVSGSGDQNGNLMILRGNIEVGSGRLEVVPGGGGENT